MIYDNRLGSQSVIFFAQKLPENRPKVSENCPNTTLKLLPNPPKNKSSK